jgi:predicted PurR-regulated permease PerM
MSVNPGGQRSYVTGLIALACFSLVTAVLYFLKPVFMPLALAVLLTFMLTPMVLRLTRWGLPRVVSILLTVLFSFTLLGGLGWIVSRQVIGLTEQLPKYEHNIRAKIASFKKPRKDSSFSKAAEVIEHLKNDIDQKPAGTVAEETAAKAEKPVAVEVKQSQPSFQVLRTVFGPVLGPLGTVGMVVILVIAMLFQREDLRERVIKLVSGGQLNLATQAVDDAGKRISRYLIMNLIINATYGLPIGVGLYFIGVPNALLWGLLATLLRFIPFLGPWIAAAFPVALAIAVDPGWTKLLLTLGLFVTVELISNNVIEPWLYGQSTGISTVALIVAAIFWTWLWGVVGLFLSTPLTVCLIVMGKYIPGLRFLSDLLGSEPALALPARFYQRMLAMDRDELEELADEFLAEHSLEELYDEVIIPALSMAERDRHTGTLAEVRQQFIFQNTRELVEELGERQTSSDPQHLEKAIAPEFDSVLCVPARDDADEITALMLAQLLRLDGVGTKTLKVTTLAEECAGCVTPQVRAVCISALPPGALAPARQLCRRLRSQFNSLTILAGFWGHPVSARELESRFSRYCPGKVLTSLREARKELKAILDDKSPKPMTAAPIPPDEEKRLSELHRLDLLDTEPEELFDAVTREVAQAFGVPISLVSLVDSDRQFWKSQTGLPPDLAKARQSARETSICGHVVAANEVIVVEDVAKDVRFADNPFLKERGIRFYAGAPLRTASGHAVGSLCVIDTQPRQVSEADKMLLNNLAEKLMRTVEQRKATPIAA